MKYQVLGLVNSHAPNAALRLSNLHEKLCQSWRQQACVGHLPVPITHPKTWRLRRRSIWQADHLLGLSACNCIPPFLGLLSFVLYPLLGRSYDLYPPNCSPSQKVPTPTGIPTINCWYSSPGASRKKTLVFARVGQKT